MGQMSMDARSYGSFLGAQAFSLQFQRILELPHGLELPDLQEAFRLRAWELHPDVSHLPDAEQRFRELKDMHDALPERFRGKAQAEAGQFWRAPGELKLFFGDQKDARVRAGLIRRIAQLEEWKSLPFLLEVLDQGEPATQWAAIHALIRLEARTGLDPMVSRYASMPRGLRCAVLRYLRAVDPLARSPLFGKVETDPDAWIQSRVEVLWSGSKNGVNR